MDGLTSHYTGAMEIGAIVQEVLSSSSDDWIKIHEWPLDVTVSEDEWVERASFRPEASIGLVWGSRIVKDFKEEWANQFPDPSASSLSVFVTWNGVPVEGDFVVVVDGGRCYLPPPNAGTADVPKRRYRLAQLLDSLTGHVSEFDSYFERSGLRVTEG